VRGCAVGSGTRTPDTRTTICASGCAHRLFLSAAADVTSSSTDLDGSTCHCDRSCSSIRFGSIRPRDRWERTVSSLRLTRSRSLPYSVHRSCRLRCLCGIGRCGCKYECEAVRRNGPQPTNTQRPTKPASARELISHNERATNIEILGCDRQPTMPYYVKCAQICDACCCCGWIFIAVDSSHAGFLDTFHNVTSPCVQRWS
jgi:hypothetical protein